MNINPKIRMSIILTRRFAPYKMADMMRAISQLVAFSPYFRLIMNITIDNTRTINGIIQVKNVNVRSIISSKLLINSLVLLYKSSYIYFIA